MKLSQAMVISYHLLSSEERRRGFGITLLSIVGGAADVMSLMAVYPLISVLVQPDLLQSNLLIRQIWEMAGAPSNNSFVVMLAAVASVIVISGAALNIFAQVQANRFASSCQERLGRDLMQALLHAPYLWHIERNPLVLGSLFQNHIVIWSRDVVRRSATIAGQIAAIALPVGALIGWSPLNGILITTAAIVLLVILLGFARRRTSRLMRQKREAEQQLHVFLSESLQGIKDVKLSSREDDFLRTFMRAHHIISSNFSAVNNWTLLPTQLVLIVGQIGILGVGAGLFLYGFEGGVLASTMAVVVLVAARVFPAMNRMGSAINSLSNVVGWIETLGEILTSLQSVQSSKLSPKGGGKRLTWNEIVISEASFTYPNSHHPALHPTNLRLLKGGAYAFTGPSGAGKSTLVDLILGLLRPTSGCIEVGGQQIAEVDQLSWRTGIGYVPQLPMINDATLRENIAFGVPWERIDDNKVRQCINLAHLSDVLNQLPEGLNTPMGDRGMRLSGGQRQRVAIARALYNDPDILVLDEATSALDTLSERAIRDALLGLQGKVTIISISHSFSTIMSYDCIFLMARGKVVAQGTFDALMKESDLFRELASGTLTPC